MNSLALINEFLGQPPNASEHGYQIDHILEFAQVARDFVLVSPEPVASARRAVELFPALDLSAVRPRDVAWRPAHSAFPLIPRVPSTTVDNPAVNRPRRFPSFRNARGRKVDRRRLHSCRS